MVSKGKLFPRVKFDEDSLRIMITKHGLIQLTKKLLFETVKKKNSIEMKER